jgi:uncharacterized protein with PIN domain
MVADTSALIAILLREDEREIFEDLMLRSATVVMSVASLVETTIAMTRTGLNADPLEA